MKGNECKRIKKEMGRSERVRGGLLWGEGYMYVRRVCAEGEGSTISERKGSNVEMVE